MAKRSFDIAIVGGGMAGASLAAELAPHARVVVLEGEAQHGYHATGRSAAFWTESYGGPLVQPLTTASGPVLRDLGMLRERGALTIAGAGDEAELARFAATFTERGVHVEMIGRAALERWIPGLLSGWTAGALEPSCSDIDVAALHQHYLAMARRSGAVLLTGARLVAAEAAAGWSLALGDGRRLAADLLVDAAGAWADPVARIAGVRPLGIVPLRRTVAQLRIDPPAPAELPLVLDLGGAFYFKPEAGRLWLSPHDETPSAPCDAAPEEIDVARAIARLAGVVDWRVKAVEHRWAGLRSFAPDRLPVYGFATDAPRFFWFAGQGGFGIQTAPAAAALAAALILGRGTDAAAGAEAIMAGALDPERYAPSRFG